MAALLAVPARAQAVGGGAASANARYETAVTGFGVFAPGVDENHAAVLDMEYRFRPWRLGIGPVIGAAATSDGGMYFRAGLGRDFPFAGRWNLHLSTAAGAYQPGNGKRLGLGFEFRSAGELSYQIQPGVRLGLSAAHLSNAGIGNRNPGVETFTVNLGFTPRRMTVR